MESKPRAEDRARSSQEALAEAARDVLRSQAAARAQRRKTASSPRRAVLAILAGWLLIAWVWAARPAWIFGEKPSPLSADQERAEMRYALFLTRQRVEEYRATSGEWPGSLADLSSREDGVTYRQQDGGYRLVGRAGSDSFVLTNRMNADSFLGNALRVLQGSP